MRKPRDFDAELKAWGTRRVTTGTARYSSLANWSSQRGLTRSALTNWRVR